MNKVLSQNSQIPTEFPDILRHAQIKALGLLGVDSVQNKLMAESILKLSDFYVMHPEKSSPWRESWAQIAYLSYYMPLNWWRLCGVLSRGVPLGFFENFNHFIDFGSGLGSLEFAFDAMRVPFQSGICVESSEEAIAIHKSLRSSLNLDLSWKLQLKDNDIKPKTLAVFSYSFTELQNLPPWVERCEGLLIVEPSTQSDSRRLLKVRKDLIQKGWHVWGPCTHELSCPLLEQSERDWCHDRFSWNQPAWLKELERHLPMKNGTLPCSWLMLSQTKPEARANHMARARMTGDLQEFKGFAKQLICRGSEREFASWQKKDFKKNYPQIGRGDLIEIVTTPEKKGNELRFKSEDQIKIF